MRRLGSALLLSGLALAALSRPSSAQDTLAPFFQPRDTTFMQIPLEELPSERFDTVRRFNPCLEPMPIFRADSTLVHRMPVIRGDSDLDTRMPVVRSRCPSRTAWQRSKP